MPSKVSIITAVFNGEVLLSKLLDSVVQQKHVNIELVVIDGCSIDNTVNIIKKFEKHISYWVSEPDKGIYDAWNKGLRVCTGDWIMFLGSDDILVAGSLKKYSDFILNLSEEVEYISSKVQMIDKENKPVRIKGWPWRWPFFLKEMTVAHPGSLHSKKLFQKYGFFNSDYKIVGDYEFLLRAKENLKAAYMNEITVLMREGGASDSVAAIKEHYKAVTKTAGYSKINALTNALFVYTKLKIKKLVRGWGINAYLKS